MGRTQRLRQKRKRSSVRETSLGHEEEYHKLIGWMKEHGWKSSVHLTPVDFPETGRGLRTLQNISCGDVLINIPGKLLMTVETASKSQFGWLFKRQTLLCQQVLAAHLLFEKHLGDQSFWVDYISYLPQYITTPVFSKIEIEMLPEELSFKVSESKSTVSEMFSDFSSSFLADDKCHHCSKSISEVFNLDSFLWAWFIVNSRSVFISPEHNKDHGLSLFDKNCLGLAPYIDIFNHSNQAKVKAFYNEVEKSYEIRTLAPFKKLSQVFIHYGDHSNIKLFLEYGFIMPNNIHDVLPVTFEEVFSTLQVHQQRVITNRTYQFLKSHDFLTNMFLSSDGISWSTRALIFVLLYSGTMDAKVIQSKVYSNDMNDSELCAVFSVAKVLIERQKLKMKEKVQKMLTIITCDSSVSEGYHMAIALYREYLNVLCRCELSIQ